MTRTIRTIAQAAKYGMALHVECMQCKRTADFLASDVAQYVKHPHRAFEDAPFVCSICGSRNMKIYPFDIEAGRDRKPGTDIVVWKPTRIRI